MAAFPNERMEQAYNLPLSNVVLKLELIVAAQYIIVVGVKTNDSVQHKLAILPAVQHHVINMKWTPDRFQHDCVPLMFQQGHHAGSGCRKRDAPAGVERFLHDRVEVSHGNDLIQANLPP